MTSSKPSPLTSPAEETLRPAKPLWFSPAMRNPSSGLRTPGSTRPSAKPGGVKRSTLTPCWISMRAFASAYSSYVTPSMSTVRPEGSQPTPGAPFSVTASPVSPSTMRVATPFARSSVRSKTLSAFSVSALSPVPVRSMRSMDLISAGRVVMRSRLRPAPSRRRMSVPVPPSISAKERSDTDISSSPAPPRITSAPPPPVIASLPASPMRSSAPAVPSIVSPATGAVGPP